MADQELDFTIERLGECRFPSPMQGVRFTADTERILHRLTWACAVSVEGDRETVSQQSSHCHRSFYS